MDFKIIPIQVEHIEAFWSAVDSVAYIYFLIMYSTETKFIIIELPNYA
ncbi:Uncharacterised protein [Legionella bozemanae]|nr:Uncharacterised protein [Legionella bozemanae]